MTLIATEARSPESIRAALAHCVCTDGYHRVGLPPILATDGAIQLAELCGAFWLLDIVASYQGQRLDRESGGFQIWTLTVLPTTNKRGAAVVECKSDTDAPCLRQQFIPFTDFPLPEGAQLFVEGAGSGARVVLLPSEH